MTSPVPVLGVGAPPVQPPGGARATRRLAASPAGGGRPRAEPAGIPAEAFAFLSGLAADNSHAWFALHRQVYRDAVDRPWRALVTALAAPLARLLPDIDAEVKTGRVLSRINLQWPRPGACYRTGLQASFGHRRRPGAGPAAARLFVALDGDGLRAGVEVRAGTEPWRRLLGWLQAEPPAAGVRPWLPPAREAPLPGGPAHAGPAGHRPEARAAGAPAAAHRAGRGGGRALAVGMDGLASDAGPTAGGSGGSPRMGPAAGPGWPASPLAGWTVGGRPVEAAGPHDLAEAMRALRRGGSIRFAAAWPASDPVLGSSALLATVWDVLCRTVPVYRIAVAGEGRAGATGPAVPDGDGVAEDRVEVGPRSVAAGEGGGRPDLPPPVPGPPATWSMPPLPHSLRSAILCRAEQEGVAPDAYVLYALARAVVDG